MSIIHYILGIPLLREDGLIKYATDLVTIQGLLGYDVYILYLGKIENGSNVQGIN